MRFEVSLISFREIEVYSKVPWPASAVLAFFLFCRQLLALAKGFSMAIRIRHFAIVDP
jgi:hypothetical protein